MRVFEGPRGVSFGSFIGTLDYSSLDCADDARENLVGDARWTLRPSRQVKLRGGRREAARVVKFWRRFSRSTAREVIMKEAEGEERVAAFDALLGAFNGRLPTKEELNLLGKVLRGAGLGEGKKKEVEGAAPDTSGTNFPQYMRDAARIAYFMGKVPRDILPIVGKRHGTPTPSPEIADEFEFRQARLGEVAREFWLPGVMYADRLGRRALTQLDWQTPAPEMRAEVEMLIDCSGSMEGDPHALAVAAALVLGEEAEKHGNKVWVRFYAYKMSERYRPEEVLLHLEKQNLGGGDCTGAVLAAIDFSTKPDAVIVVSDFCIEGAAETKEVALLGGQNVPELGGREYFPRTTLHTFKISYSGQTPYGAELMKRAGIRKDFRKLLGEGSGG